MSLIRRNSDWPFLNRAVLSDFFDGDRFFDATWPKPESLPAVNVKETDKGFELELAAPGLTKKDFNISVDDHLLTISSEKKEEKQEKEKGYTRREFSYSSFSRSFALPENVNESDVKARYEDGVLKLNLSKSGALKAKAKKMIEVA